MGLFGGGNSSSSTQNKTDNIDQKLQMATGSVGGTASGGGVVNINTSDMGAIDSSFKFANAAIDANAYITDGALGFAAANSDSAFRLVNATTDGAFKAIDSTVTSTTKAMQQTTANAMALANGATDSALRFGDSTVSKAFDFSKAITAGAANEVAASATRADQLVTNAMGSVKDAYSDMSSTLADAYTNAKAGEQKVMVAAALAILGLVAIKMGR
jgi:hypothetical protein